MHQNSGIDKTVQDISSYKFRAEMGGGGGGGAKATKSLKHV